MALITWDDSFCVDISFIDRQHKKLVTLVNELHYAMQLGKEKYILEKILQDLVAYTQEHFSTEERVFDQINYPDMISHKKEHSNLVEKVVAFKNDWDSGKAGITPDLMNFLKSWLQDHIKGSDMKYVSYFKENEVF